MVQLGKSKPSAVKNHPTTIAGCLLLDEDGKILLMHRNTAKRVQWEIPGGKVKNEEHPEAAAIRELKEELGVTVVITRELGRATVQQEGQELHFIWHLAYITAGTPQPVETEVHDQIGYFSWEELEQMRDKLSVNTQALLNAYSKGEVEV